MRAQEIRKEALSKLEGNWIPMIGMCLLTAIAVAALNWLSVLLIPLLIPGLCAFTLKLIRGAKPEITDLVSTYKNYLNALVAYVLFAVIIAVWTFLIVVPCVFFIHLLFAEIFLEIFISPVLTAYALLMTVCSLLLVIPAVIFYYMFSQIFYLLADNPQIGAVEVLKRSAEMMKGYKWKLFCLHLSFIGWYLLGIVTLGIAFIWVGPYIKTANTIFYENLKSLTDKNTIEVDPLEVK